MKRTVPFWIMALLLLFIGCREKEPRSSQIQRPVVSGVTFIKISPSSIDSFYETSGTVKAGTTSIVASRTMGTVLAVKIKEGDRVKAGEVLMTLDDRDMAEKVAQAEAAYQEALKGFEAAEQNKSLAEVTFGRYKNLYAEKVITQQEMDQIETQKKVAAAESGRLKEMVKRTKAALEEAKIYRGFSMVTAPVSGVITEKKIEPGNLAAPGLPLLTIENTDQFKVEAYINEHFSQRFKKGDKVYILLENNQAADSRNHRRDRPGYRSGFPLLSDQNSGERAGNKKRPLLPGADPGG